MDDSGLPTPPTPPTPPPAPVPEPIVPETPVIVTPKKKFPLKLAAGALMMLLLIGGTVFLSRQLVQQRQTSESQAENTSSDVTCVPGASYDGCQGFKKKCKGDAVRHETWDKEVFFTCEENFKPKPCPNGQPPVCTKPPVYQCCTTLADCKSKWEWPDRVVIDNDDFCPQSNIKIWDCNCEASPSPTPSPSPEVSPGPSPSPLVGLTCVDLTKNTAAPKVGDVVTFTCESSAATGMSPVAFFRSSTDDGVTFSTGAPTSGVAVNATTHKANYDITINQSGAWEVQCRVCTDSSAVNCTDWGKALTTVTP